MPRLVHISTFGVYDWRRPMTVPIAEDFPRGPGRGYGNFKLPLIFVAMLLPLVFTGAGRLSLDELIRRRP